MERPSLEELRELLEKNDYPALRARLSQMNAVDVADFIHELPPTRQVLVFRLLPKDTSAEAFAYLDSDVQAQIVGVINNQELGALVEALYLDDTVDFLEEVPANIVRRVMAVADTETRRAINRFLQYPENSAGSIMTNEMVALHDRLTVAQAMAEIRRTGLNKETIYTCYCIDNGRRLVGTVDLSSLIFHEPEECLRDLMDDRRQLISVNTHDDQEMVADLARKYDLLSVPVTDNESRLVGIVTIDDIVDIIEQENTEDLERMALIQPSADTYMKTGVMTMFRNRILWLTILMLSATLTGRIIQRFEGTLALVAGLATAIPMLMGTGGNAGSQSATMIIRGLALGEIQLRDYVRVIWKELRVSLLCGLALAAMNLIRMWALGERRVVLMLVVSAAMCCAVVFAKLVGSTLPVVAKATRLDPALMAGPMLSTIVDATTLMIYFSLSSVFLF